MSPFEELQSKAEMGDARAQLDLALAYQNRLGPETDHARAAEWCRKAADQGLDEAQYELGTMFHFGHGVEKDCAEAIKWLRKAAEQGHPLAGCQLGWMYLGSRDVEKDHAEAIKWFRKAADHGSSASQYNLGTLYAGEQGAERDDAQALKWLRKAADQGHEAAQYFLGGMYAEGRGVEKDETEAVAWFRKAAAQGYAAAHANLRRWDPAPGKETDKAPSAQFDQDLGLIIKTTPHALRILDIRHVDFADVSLRLVAMIAGSPRIAGSSRFLEAFEIVCFNAVDYSIRPKNPATIEGGPMIEFHEKHPLLEAGHLQLVPGGDGEVFRPPLDLKVLILDQSHVIAERFEIHKCADSRPRPRSPQ